MQLRFPFCSLGHPFDAKNSGGWFCTKCRNHKAKLAQRIRRSDPVKLARIHELSRGYDAKRRGRAA